MRVTSASLYPTLQADLNASLASVQRLQTQLSSGKRIQAYSDDPVGAAEVLRSRSEESAWAAYQKAADDANAWLGTADTALQSMTSLLRNARDLAIQSQNGALSADSRAAIADQVDQLQSQLADLANAQYLGRSVFGGFAASAVVPDGSGGWTWTGDSGQVLRRVSPDVTVQANVDGAAALGFQPGQTDAFTVLSQLSASIRAGGATSADVSALDTRLSAVTSGLGLVGAATNRVQAASDLGKSTVDALTAQRSRLEDTDMAEAVLQLNEAQLGYQAALGAASRADLPSLADFLQ